MTCHKLKMSFEIVTYSESSRNSKNTDEELFWFRSKLAEKIGFQKRVFWVFLQSIVSCSVLFCVHTKSCISFDSKMFPLSNTLKLIPFFDKNYFFGPQKCDLKLFKKYNVRNFLILCLANISSYGKQKKVANFWSCGIFYGVWKSKTLKF